MRRKAAKVIVLEYKASSVLDGWIDRIELRRSAHAKFEVLGKRYADDPDTGKRRWGHCNKTVNLREPSAIRRALQSEAEKLAVSLDWSKVVPLISSVDWLAAAVIAQVAGVTLPSLLSADVLLTQRALRPIGQVKIGVACGYDVRELEISFERWIRILDGEAWTIEEPYYYEGQRFTGCWSFDSRLGISMTYGGGGTGWEGELGSIDIIDGPKMDGVDIARLALSAASRR